MARTKGQFSVEMAKTPSRKAEATSESHCVACDRLLREEDRALFVEEEKGRIFCSEECILNFFSPEIEKMEEEYARQISDSDLSEEDREKLTHLRNSTITEPDELWREMRVTGDYYYTLISEFSFKKKPVWCICRSLFLRGEPSFLFMSIVTKNAALVNNYRKGEQIEWTKPQPEGSSKEKVPLDAEQVVNSSGMTLDSVTVPFTDDEQFRAEVLKHRKKDDIAFNEFEAYQYCLDDTLKHPEEVWSWKSETQGKPKVYHFIKHYPKEEPSFWYVVVARETDDRDQLEILETFPTRDTEWLGRFRFGVQEIGETHQATNPGRILH